MTVGRAGWIILGVLLAGIARAQQPNDSEASLAGVVTGVQGARIVVHLSTVDDNPLHYYDGYEVQAGSDGKFRFDHIEPGRYLLTAGAVNYIAKTPSDGLRVTLSKGEKIKGVTLALVPKQVVCGHISENRKPKATWVNAFRLNPEFGTLTDAAFVQTDKDGNYRFDDLAPGTYYIQAYMTWYPSTYHFNDAKPVEVSQQTNAACKTDISFTSSNCSVATVTGQIGGDSHDKNKYKILLLQTNPNGGTFQELGTFLDKNEYRSGDSFRASTCPGEYDLVIGSEDNFPPWGAVPSRKIILGDEHIKLTASGIKNVVLTPASVTTIRGELHYVDPKRGADCPAGGPRQTVSILREGDGQYQSTEWDIHDNFSFENVALGKYSVYLGPFLREALYVQSIKVNGIEIKGREFQVLDAEPVSLVIMLNSDPALANGHISPDVRRNPRWQTAESRPKGTVAGRIESATKTGYTVKLLSARYNSNSSVQYRVQPSRDGDFLFDHVDPGVYRLRVEGNGTLAVEYGATQPGTWGMPIVVKRAARLKNLVLAPPSPSSICGRVVDAESGRPQPELRMFLLRYYRGSFFNGGVASPSEQTTNASGDFQWHDLAPADYYPAAPIGTSLRFFTKDGTFDDALPIHVAVGESPGCSPGKPLEFRIPSSPTRSAAILGTIKGDLSSTLGDRFWVSLASVNQRGERLYITDGFAKLDASHRFRFGNVTNGHYELTLRSGYGAEPRVWSGPYGPRGHILAKQPLFVQGEGAQNVEIGPIELPVISGTVKFQQVPDDWGKYFKVDSHQIRLEHRPHGFVAPPPVGSLDSAGKFNLGPTDIGDYRVDLQLRNPLYIRSARLDGVEVDPFQVHIPAATFITLDVDVSDDSGQVNVDVSDDTSLPTPEPSVHEECQIQGVPGNEVLLLPETASPDDPNRHDISVPPHFLISGPVSADGARVWQKFFNVPPGHYRAIAIQRIAPYQLEPGGQLWQLEWNSTNPSWWAAVSALAVPVTVEPHGDVHLTLPDRTIDVEKLASKFALPLDGE
jgi:hypothetical protein